MPGGKETHSVSGYSILRLTFDRWHIRPRPRGALGALAPDGDDPLERTANATKQHTNQIIDYPSLPPEGRTRKRRAGSWSFCLATKPPAETELGCSFRTDNTSLFGRLFRFVSIPCSHFPGHHAAYLPRGERGREKERGKLILIAVPWEAFHFFSPFNLFPLASWIMATMEQEGKSPDPLPFSRRDGECCIDKWKWTFPGGLASPLRCRGFCVLLPSSLAAVRTVAGFYKYN